MFNIRGKIDELTFGLKRLLPWRDWYVSEIERLRRQNDHYAEVIKDGQRINGKALDAIIDLQNKLEELSGTHALNEQLKIQIQALVGGNGALPFIFRTGKDGLVHGK